MKMTIAELVSWMEELNLYFEDINRK